MSRPRNAGPPSIAIYTRVSTEDQAISGLGLADQLERCQAYCTAIGQGGSAEVRVFTDAGTSAKSLQRPALTELLDLVEHRRVAAVIVLKIDRIARKTLDLLQLIERLDRCRTKFISVNEALDTSTSAGRLILTILGACAQAEREAISERTKAAIAAKLRQGLAHGWCPLGLVAIDGRLVEDEDEQATIGVIVDLRHNGLSLRQIGFELRRLGCEAKRGGRWTPQNVANVLRRAWIEPSRGVGSRPTVSAVASSVTALPRRAPHAGNGARAARSPQSLREHPRLAAALGHP